MSCTLAPLQLTALLSDAVALSDALRAGDLPEARFRARLIANGSVGPDLGDVRDAARNVERLLGTGGHPPATRYAMAVLGLADAFCTAAARSR
jgi:hypothetical protein